MEQTFCVQCGGKLAAGQLFCPACGEKSPPLPSSAATSAASGPKIVKTPDGYPDIDLSVYGDMSQQAIEKINTLNGTERIAWVQAGQPYILSWTNGAFLTWLQRNHTPIASAQPSGPVTQAPVTPSAPTAGRANGHAIAGFVLSLSSIVIGLLVNPFILVVLGIIFSSIGISTAAKRKVATGVATGRGLAIAGLVISIILAVIIFIAFL